MTENHDLFKALSDPTRLRIACLLTAGQLCVCDLTELLDLPQSTVSRHMAKLKNAGLVTDQRSGRWVHYRLAETSGTVEAADINAAAGNLRSQRKIITSLKEIGDVTKERDGSFFTSPFDYVSFICSSDMVILFRQLSALITAGVTLVNSLQILQRQIKKRNPQINLGAKYQRKPQGNA